MRGQGRLWEVRFRSCLVQDNDDLLSCYRYIELNPVRAGKTEHPGDYRWSSYRCNGQGETNPVVTPHPLYLAPDEQPDRRRERSRHRVKVGMGPERVNECRDATNGNDVLGSTRFAEQFAQALGQRTQRGKAGRPAKKK